jgi:hypothetical protein
MDPAEGMNFLLLVAPSALRQGPERIHDVATTIRADVPETATKVLMLYRLSNGFARAASQVTDGQLDRPGFDSRFDVQVRQSLPFLDFSAARWEMLVAVRNFFATPAMISPWRRAAHHPPPKRIVGGVTVYF